MTNGESDTITINGIEYKYIIISGHHRFYAMVEKYVEIPVLIAEWENEDEENNTVGLEDYKIESNDKTIYDLQGRILNEIPTKGFYIQGGKKYIVIK